MAMINTPVVNTEKYEKVLADEVWTLIDVYEMKPKAEFNKIVIFNINGGYNE